MPAETTIETQSEADAKMVDLPAEGNSVDVEISDKKETTVDTSPKEEVKEEKVITAAEVKSLIENLRFHSFFSRWYSAQQANNLKKEYEKENNFKYDCVFITRYDLLAFEDFVFSDYDMSYFYAPFSIWQTRVSGYTVATSINDLWFFSSSDQIDEFSKVFLDMGKYVKDSANNPTSPHLTVSNKLRESNSKLKLVLNSDVHDNCDVSHTATLRMREAKYWNYNDETKLYKLKQEYKEKLNKSEHEIDWSKNFQSQWPLYKGMTADEFKEYLATTGWNYSDGTPV